MFQLRLSIKRNDASVIHITYVKVEPMSLPLLTPRSTLGSDRFSGLACPPFAAVMRRLSIMRALHRQRSRLAAMDQAALDDIGITRAMAEAEAQRPVWDLPAHWRG
jgi:uncharacterized protein YjiS (DUF1127 family)